MLTYGDFVKTYYNPEKVSDEQALEGLYYTSNVFENLNKEGKALVGLFVGIAAKMFLDRSQNDFKEHPAWHRAILAILANIILEQGEAGHEPMPTDFILRSESMWVISAEVLQIPRSNLYNNQKPSNN